MSARRVKATRQVARHCNCASLMRPADSNSFEAAQAAQEPDFAAVIQPHRVGKHPQSQKIHAAIRPVDQRLGFHRKPALIGQPRRDAVAGVFEKFLVRVPQREVVHIPHVHFEKPWKPLRIVACPLARRHLTLPLRQA